MHLPEGEIHLWFAFPTEAGDPQTPGPECSLLDEEERARMARLRFPAGRRLFGASHALVRIALSQYSEIPPGKWRFVRNAHGKPAIDPGLGPSPLSFSLSHTRGGAVVAVARGAEVGADIEREDRKVHASRLGSRFFSPEEAAALNGMPPDRLRGRFFLYWTLKESYIKAKGVGLSMPLDSFSFRIEGEHPGRIGFCAGNRTAEEWRFAAFRPRPPYVAAVGCAASRPVRVRCFQDLPAGPAPLCFETLALSPCTFPLTPPAGCDR